MPEGICGPKKGGLGQGLLKTRPWYVPASTYFLDLSNEWSCPIDIPNGELNITSNSEDMGSLRGAVAIYWPVIHCPPEEKIYTALHVCYFLLPDELLSLFLAHCVSTAKGGSSVADSACVQLAVSPGFRVITPSRQLNSTVLRPHRVHYDQFSE